MNEEYDFSNYLNKPSSRHHYIPRFLINGFTNSDGLLYIYDKKKDEILKKPRPPKSIFFENNRNTLELNKTTKSSIIEDLLYAKIDQKTSPITKYYQTEELSKINFQIEDNAIFLFFLITLFWRIPNTDYTASNLMDNFKIIANGIDPELLKRDPVFRKISRATLFKHHIDEIKRLATKGKKWVNIHQSGIPIYVIGDYPILFRNQTDKFSEINNTDILTAVSSNRIYSSTNNKLTNFSTRHSMLYNACIINQSMKYIACGALDSLEESISLYKKVKDDKLLNILPEKVFEISLDHNNNYE